MHLLLVPNRARDAKRRKITVLELRFYDTRKNFKDLGAYKIEKRCYYEKKEGFVTAYQLFITCNYFQSIDVKVRRILKRPDLHIFLFESKIYTRV